MTWLQRTWRPRICRLLRQLLGPFWSRIPRGWERLLPLGLDCRNRLPNFPRSSAAYGRERQRLVLRRLAPDGCQALPLIILTFQFVGFRGDHQVSPVMELQPLFEFQILFHPASTRVEDYKTQLQRAALHQILLDELFPLRRYCLRDASVSISGQIDKLELIAYPIEV